MADVGTAQQITLVSAEPPIRVTGIRGADPPTITGGYGGWTTVARPRKKSITEWDGIEPWELNLPLLFDGYAANLVNGVREDESVELECARLEQLAGVIRPRGEPPLLQVIGAAPHATAVGVTWVVKGLEWTQPVIWHEDGFRTRQGVTVDLLEYVAPDRLLTVGAAEEARLRALDEKARAAREHGVGGSTPAHDKIYTVRSGDTLTSIAADKLGDFRRWVEIAEINEVRDPRRLKVGQVLRLP